MFPRSIIFFDTRDARTYFVSLTFEKGDVIVFERKGDRLYLKAGNES